MNRRQHPDGARAQARQVYLAHGAKRAAEVTGVSVRTIRYWARQEGWRQPAATPGNRPHLRVAPVAGMRQPLQKGQVAAWQPQRVLERLAAELWAQLEVLAGLRATGKPTRDAAVTLGILADKCVDLAKQTGVGSGRPDPDGAVARINAMLDQIEQRRPDDA